TRSAKLFVPAGAPDHLSAGEMFLPEQPKPLNTCSSAIMAFGLMSALSSLSPCANAAPANARATATTSPIRRISSPQSGARPGASALGNPDQNLRRLLALLPRHVQMRDYPDHPASDPENEHAPFPCPRDHGRGIGRLAGQSEDDDVRFHRGQVEHDARA